ncbi:hypothetical protein [Helicobacter mustelae]|uniref:Uncharacterized protein n=1 Tax=Helicobacter mustelae (strain ATCC 43772 / CCUG 25715 / CIP 103759 / LMG 18044 / NCTC 12198 / R85-136P) TaxID=679897 RepID=D3UJL1_HELM1|nr:hypothetical protein [Helicobacter mustelae]CBG40688.1 Putative hypothetical protein [Helicobacter mustelae 12198]SQH72186.1 Uncharacterised protein [Helicobacter mustelae]
MKNSSILKNSQYHTILIKKKDFAPAFDGEIDMDALLAFCMQRHLLEDCYQKQFLCQRVAEDGILLLVTPTALEPRIPELFLPFGIQKDGPLLFCLDRCLVVLDAGKMIDFQPYQNISEFLGALETLKAHHPLALHQIYATKDYQNLLEYPFEILDSSLINQLFLHCQNNPGLFFPAQKKFFTSSLAGISGIFLGLASFIVFLGIGVELYLFMLQKRLDSLQEQIAPLSATSHYQSRYEILGSLLASAEELGVHFEELSLRSKEDQIFVFAKACARKSKHLIQWAKSPLLHEGDFEDVSSHFPYRCTKAFWQS